MPPATTAPDPVFLYVAGDPALELVNTVDWTPRGLEEDRLSGYEQLTRWAEGAGVIGADTGRRLRRLAADRPRAAAAALELAHRTRSSIRDLFVAIARGESREILLSRFNQLLAEATERLQVAQDAAGGFQWSWREQESDPRGLLWPVIWSAAKLLESDEVGSVRICDGDDCGWMYVDRSRNGLRRWCQMKTCGTREKTRRRRVG